MFLSSMDLSRAKKLNYFSTNFLPQILDKIGKSNY